MKRSTNKYTVLNGQLLEMDDDHAELYEKYTGRQLRYVLARMIFPEESHAAGACSPYDQPLRVEAPQF